MVVKVKEVVVVVEVVVAAEVEVVQGVVVAHKSLVLNDNVFVVPYIARVSMIVALYLFRIVAKSVAAWIVVELVIGYLYNICVFQIVLQFIVGHHIGELQHLR